ncbi:hypothetical protein DL95DRAFT_122624 [Leptodontidium sp. 2 PMI_412]|nr:hypothetical protein DL95DRAFT_122624 [Leptodontidium sp. 2 PMI_412]
MSVVVMAGEKTQQTHPFTPVWKIGDFGLARNTLRVGHNVPVALGGAGWLGGSSYVTNNGQLRTVGTPGWYVPEQFTPRWNYRDYRASSLCAKFGSWTNVWQLGAIMYSMASIYDGPPEPWYPFHPSALPASRSFLIGGAPALGITYGTKLRITKYSVTLKDAIHECLYEEPTHRPTLIALKARIAAAIAARLAAGDVPEGWQDLDMPEPRTPAMVRRDPATWKPCTRTLGQNVGPQCGKLVRADPENMRVRCPKHFNLIRHPWGF